MVNALSGIDIGGPGFSPSRFPGLEEDAHIVGGRLLANVTDTVNPNLFFWDDDIKLPDEFFRLRRPTAAQRLEYRYWRAAKILVDKNDDDGGATERLWNQLHCLIDTHRRYSAPVETIQVDVNPVPRVSLRPPNSPSEDCRLQLSGARCRNLLRELLASEECPESGQLPRLDAGLRGMAATIADCRSLDQRSRDSRPPGTCRGSSTAT